MGVAFLRGINLGKRRVTNDELVAVAQSLDFGQVSAYQAAGNLLFEPGRVANPAEALSAGLEAALGYPVRVFVRSREEVVRLAQATPFSPEAVAQSAGKVQVTLLDAVPRDDQVDAVHAIGTDEDRVRVIDAHWFWLPNRGVGKSTLDVAAIERIVGLGTTRTQGTLQRIASKLAR